MIVSENSLALAALILAVSALDAWSVVVNPRLSEREIDQIRDHCGARLLYYTVTGPCRRACPPSRRPRGCDGSTGRPGRQRFQRGHGAGSRRGGWSAAGRCAAL